MQVLHGLAVAHLEGDGSPETALNSLRMLRDQEVDTPAVALLMIKALWQLGSMQVSTTDICRFCCRPLSCCIAQECAAFMP